MVTWNHIIVCKLLELHKSIYNLADVYKLLVLGILYIIKFLRKGVPVV